MKTKMRPFLHRLLEGATTSAMPIGFVLAGGDPRSMLFFYYVVHAACSLSFHLHPCNTTYWLDTSFINMIIAERVYNVNCSTWMFAAQIVAMMLERENSHWWTSARVMCAIFGTLTYSSALIVGLWMSCASGFLLSMWCASHGLDTMTTLTCCLYHSYLGVLSWMEVPLYKDIDGDNLVWHAGHAWFLSSTAIKLKNVLQN